MRQVFQIPFAVLLSASLAFAQVAPQQQAAPAGQGVPAPASKATTAERRRAAKLYLSAARLYEAGQFEPALKQYQQAAELDPANADYAMAVEVTRSHAVTALIQAAAKARTQDNTATARAALTHAQELAPKNANVAEHLRQLADSVAPEPAPSRLERTGYALGSLIELEPKAGTQSFHARASASQLIRQVYKAYGIDATVDSSVKDTSARLDLDDASFREATQSLALVTGTFTVTIDPHRVLVARDTQEFRRQFERNAAEDVPLLGLNQAEMNEVLSVSKNVFEMPHTNLDAGASTLSIQAPESSIKAFNTTWRDLVEGRPEVVVEVKLIQLAHSSARTTGVQPPQTVTAFNVYAEEQAILNANQSLVQEIISSGLAAPGDTLTILAILLASGEVTSSIFTNGILLFGGGLTLSGLSPGPLTFNLNLNSSDSKQLDVFQLRLEDGEEGTLKSGTSYPIMTSSYGTLGSGTSIAGLTSAGNSSALSGLLSSLTSSQNIPMVQYQDLGLTFKVRPTVLRSGDVSLSFDMKVRSLAGESLNDVPILANRAYSGVATMRAGEAVVVAGEMDSSETRAVSGTPGLSEIPGLNDATDKNAQKSSSTLLIIMTPHVVRSPHGSGHSPMQWMERTAQAR